MDGQKHQRPLLSTKVFIIICPPQDYLDYLDYCMSYPGSGLLVVHQMYEQENFYIRPFIVIGNFFIIFSFSPLSRHVIVQVALLSLFNYVLCRQHCSLPIHKSSPCFCLFVQIYSHSNMYMHARTSEH